ncbi:phospholipase D1 isoform X1 [Halyomorpha halys]|uniref:phospholipase D1 isoform X1 n=1 Tax=Halyomorpha halys TaxID=286706 RepID=UPI0006D522F4|nr:phospholipase D1 isoform X1 [Halyomorpha halys]XP_024214061.1 phospholipase D1 isoform X1 [Halyomorpha halys]
MTKEEIESGNGSEPASLDSEYDDGLAISDIDVPSPVTSPSEQRKNLDAIYNFRLVHKEPVKFKSPQRRVFNSDQEIYLDIIDYERSVTTHIIYPNLYTIQLRYGEFMWTVKKRYSQIYQLHQQLRLYRASLKIPLPTKAHKERRSSFKQEASRNKHSNRKMPRFPSKPEALVPIEQLPTRMQQLEDYLRSLLKIKIYRNHHELANFFEVSHLSFIYELGDKGKEGMVQKRTQRTASGSSAWNICGCLNQNLCVRCNFVCADLCGSWRTRWLVVKDNFIVYTQPSSGREKCVLLFDSAFEVSCGIFPTNVLLITNLSRQVVIKCPTRRTARDWQTYIREKLRNEGADFTQRSRYMSFVPPRPNVFGCWLTDGCSYMSAVASALEQAKQEIYIADWWLSPEIQLRRPPVGETYRLDRILQKKAEEGVKIFILLYKEVEMALGINSFYSKQRLISECRKPENLKILRHPDHAKAGVFFWAHHEKLVVIDQTVAFLGGIDLCYGRWDDRYHRLTDLGISPEENMEPFLSLGLPTSFSPSSVMSLNSNSNRESLFEDVMVQPSPENIKCDTPEMGRKSMFDTVKSRMHLWNFSSEDDSDDDYKQSVSSEQNEDTVLNEESKLKSNISPYGIKSSLDVRCFEKLWVGKDYTNFILKDFQNLDRPFEDLVDRSKTPRMPWHDVGVMVQGPPARDLARHFIQRWNAVKAEKSKLNPQYPYLLPKSYRNFTEFIIPGVKQNRINCQVVRSISHWSCGALDPEFWEGSIHEAYVDIISKAEHYIYIENQFFITGGLVKNQVGDALVKRILRAHREGTQFRVYVILPLLPGFEGEVGSPSGTALHAITHWNYASICRGKSSLLHRLKNSGIADPSEYITFHGLRNHAELNDAPVTELIYVHSKLLIADDKVMICGSANINDRSLLGVRDSEIAVVITDEDFKPGIMAGKEYMSGRFCGSLRRSLFREHLDLSGPKIKDPVCSEFYHGIWRKTAEKNTKIYEEVFRCLPSDEVKCFDDIKSHFRVPLTNTNLGAAKELLQKIQGYLVMFPLEFLKDESLTPNPGRVEVLLPTSVWT